MGGWLSAGSLVACGLLLAYLSQSGTYHEGINWIDWMALPWLVAFVAGCWALIRGRTIREEASMRPRSLRATGPMPRSLAAGGIYFAVVFGIGFALGTVRVLITGPRLGETAAVLLEVPVIVTASWFVAKWCVTRFAVPSGAVERLTMGFVAFCLTMLAELAMSILLFNHTVSEHFATYSHLPGLVGLMAQLLFALLPYAQGRVGDVRRGAESGHGGKTQASDFKR